MQRINTIHKHFKWLQNNSNYKVLRKYKAMREQQPDTNNEITIIIRIVNLLYESHKGRMRTNMQFEGIEMK